MFALLVLVLMLTGLGACSGALAPPDQPPLPPDPPAIRVGQVVHTWDAGDEEGGAVADAVEGATPLLLADQARYDAWLAGLPASVDAVGVEDLDLTNSFVLVTAYPHCAQESTLLWDDVFLKHLVTTPADAPVCDFSPVRVQVWQIERSAVGTIDPADIRVGEGTYHEP